MPRKLQMVFISGDWDYGYKWSLSLSSVLKADYA